MKKKKNNLRSELRFIEKIRIHALRGLIDYNFSGLKQPLAKAELIKAYEFIDRAIGNEIDYLKNNPEDYKNIYG